MFVKKCSCMLSLDPYAHWTIKNVHMDMHCSLDVMAMPWGRKAAKYGTGMDLPDRWCYMDWNYITCS